MAMRTARQKAALRKAQLASARKRRGKGKAARKTARKTRRRATARRVASKAMPAYNTYRSLRRAKGTYDFDRKYLDPLFGRGYAANKVLRKGAMYLDSYSRSRR